MKSAVRPSTGLKGQLEQATSWRAFSEGAKGKGSADCNYKCASNSYAGSIRGRLTNSVDVNQGAGTDCAHGADDEIV